MTNHPLDLQDRMRSCRNIPSQTDIRHLLALLKYFAFVSLRLLEGGLGCYPWLLMVYRMDFFVDAGRISMLTRSDGPIIFVCIEFQPLPIPRCLCLRLLKLGFERGEFGFFCPPIGNNIRSARSIVGSMIAFMPFQQFTSMRPWTYGFTDFFFHRFPASLAPRFMASQLPLVRLPSKE